HFFRLNTAFASKERKAHFVNWNIQLGRKANMKRKLSAGLILAAITLIAVATQNIFKARANHDDDTTYRARLSGFGEVLPKLVGGSGRFNGTLSADKTSITWTISWTGLTGPAQAAHIHFGQTQVNGNVVVFFCGGGGRPACPDGPNHSG